MAPEDINDSSKTYDTIIVGGGPAGLTAGIYAARNGQDAVLLEKMSPGGQVLSTDSVENYSGFPQGISGFQLMERMTDQAEEFGLPILNQEVRDVDFIGKEKKLISASGYMKAQSIIICTGAQPRMLGIEGEKMLTGKGVSYCGTCDGPFFRDAVVAVIGGGDTAIEEAIFLTRFVKHVYVIHRRDKLRAAKILQDRAFANGKIEFIWDSVPVSIKGRNSVEKLCVRNIKTESERDLEVEGVFIFVGTRPITEFLNKSLELDNLGFIKTNRSQETSVPGVYAAGDVTSDAFRQISIAVGEGASAALYAEKYIENLMSC